MVYSRVSKRGFYSLSVAFPGTCFQQLSMYKKPEAIGIQRSPENKGMAYQVVFEDGFWLYYHKFIHNICLLHSICILDGFKC